jgi:pilus assembly protein CpaF
VSFEVILPFLRPIEHLILDADISEIMVNGSSRVFIERRGLLEAVPGVSIEEKTLQIAVKNIARRLGDEISDERPLLDSRLPDGSRVAAIFPPCSIGGTTLTIRKFAAKLFTVEELMRIGTLTPAVLDLLRAAIADRKNILISGGTSTGKTTMLNALASLIDSDDRIVVIEDTAELHLEQANLVRFEARREQPATPAITIRDLVKATMRHRPDRILVGEVRGAEAFDLLQALNTGHSGTLATIHANNAVQSITRLASCVLQSDVQLPFHAIRSSIGDSINVLLHIERRNGQRIVSELVEVDGYDQAKDRFEFRLHYRASKAGEDGHAAAIRV